MNVSDLCPCSSTEKVFPITSVPRRLISFELVRHVTEIYVYISLICVEEKGFMCLPEFEPFLNHRALVFDPIFQL